MSASRLSVILFLVAALSYTFYAGQVDASGDQGTTDEPEKPDEPVNPDEPDEPDKTDEPECDHTSATVIL